MRFVLPFTEQDVRRGEQVPLTPNLVAKSTFEGVRAAFNYWIFCLRPVLQGLVNPTLREQSFLGLFNRAIGFIASIRKLNHAMHVQSIAGCTRSLFEIGVDIELFHRDGTNDSSSRIEAFTRVERYRVAQKLVDYYANRPLPPDVNIDEQQRLVRDQHETTLVDGLVTRYWRRRNRRGDVLWPSHWSAFSDTRTRARAVSPEWEERYVRYFSTFSWHIHSGLVGVAGLPRDVFEVFVCQAHQLATSVILDCYNVAGSEVHLQNAIPDWQDHQHFLRHVSGIALLDERLVTLGEPSRFTYLEPHEHEPV
jgi:Family of unknown function (DUF5677)